MVLTVIVVILVVVVVMVVVMVVVIINMMTMTMSLFELFFHLIHNWNTLNERSIHCNRLLMQSQICLTEYVFKEHIHRLYARLMFLDRKNYAFSKNITF